MGSRFEACLACRCEATCWKSAKRNRPQGHAQQDPAHKRQRGLAPAGAEHCAQMPDSHPLCPPMQQPHSTVLQGQIAVDRQAVDFASARLLLHCMFDGVQCVYALCMLSTSRCRSCLAICFPCFWRYITECSGPPVLTSARIAQPICLACELFMQSSEGDSASLYACSTRAHLVSFVNRPVKIHPATADVSSCSRHVAISWLPHHLCLARPTCRHRLSIAHIIDQLYERWINDACRLV